MSSFMSSSTSKMFSHDSHDNVVEVLANIDDKNLMYFSIRMEFEQKIWGTKSFSLTNPTFHSRIVVLLLLVRQNSNTFQKN